MKEYGLALAGGGIVGGIYHIGTLCALEQGLEGLDFTKAKHMVGVSAGAIISSCIANGMKPADLARSLVAPAPGEPEFRPDIFFTPAFERYANKSMKVPSLVWDAFRDVVLQDRNQSFLNSVLRFSRLIPGGVFSNKPIKSFLEELFSKEGRSNDFRELKTSLRIVATDLDSSKSVVFGRDDEGKTPISLAVQASSALPGVYPPVEINGRSYVDGVLKKTMHASVALKEGCPLLICVNPLVPIDTSKAIEKGAMRRGRLVERGLPGILSQTFRTIVHSRMQVGYKNYEFLYPASDIILFEPSLEDYTMFFTNILSFSSRLKVCEHAYNSALQQLVDRRKEIEPILRKHGITYRNGFLKDTNRSLWEEVIPERKKPGKKLEHALFCLESRIEALTDRSFSGE